MKCQRAQQRLMAYHDSELSSGAGRRLEKHLETCEECSRLLEKLRLADEHASTAVGVEEMSGVPGGPAPDDKYWESFTARVLDRVEEDAATRAPEWHKPRRSWDLFIPKMAPAFSIALVVVVAAGVLMKMGGPTRVVKAPTAAMESSEKYTASTVQKKDAAARPRSGETGEQTTREVPTPTGDRERAPVESRPQAAGATQLPDETEPIPVTSPPPVQEPEEVAAPEERAAETVDFRKKEVLPAQEDVSGAEGEFFAATAADTEGDVVAGPVDDADGVKASGLAAAGELKDETVRQALAAEEIAVEETPKPQVSMKKAAPASALEAEEIETPESQVSMKKAAPAAALEAGEEQIFGQDEVPPPSPEPLPTVGSALPELDEIVGEAEISPADGGREGMSALAPADVTQAPPGPDVRSNETSSLAPVEPPDDSQAGATATRTLESAAPPRNYVRNLPIGNYRYRVQEDQLTHARNLADVRKFWESEQVLKDLLDQAPAATIQEEASILLVKVLSSQNRIMEAQQVLDDAKVQFPASDMVQTYELKSE